ncbi:bifunctional folylpolyglutamate synthase/dihydrofolate synthase [Lactobacillus sp. CC-MHH1034]|uniref:bifunctional folylpolyglutamate synthase/dihydrofolate synthase n=1 Tax=Agrilactobacillus fermenti TaxID=2586909 RepID=UPI001E35900F|nr:Mur ligase family protein [Agrilactobacillus fermenti]MCD2256071.1 bifunctional folylpolyglutamate synthase/dihydrofolate synthase [Agrilactobacillus fermenti]
MTKVNDEVQFHEYLKLIKTTMRYGSENRIELLRQVLTACDHPDLSFKIVHICGTNGKGSTGYLIGELLQQAGLRVGRFSSPAIYEDREMIQLNGQLVSYAAFNQAFNELLTALQQRQLALTQLSEFECWFLIAMLVFRQAQVAWVILECGLGGELDATNAIATAAYDVFTHIDLDHMALLGNTITAIATTKARIIRPQAEVINYPAQYPIVDQIIADLAAQRQAYYHHAKTSQLVVQRADLNGTDLLFQTQEQAIPLHLNLAGAYQVKNLATVLAFVHVYNQKVQTRLITTEMIQTVLQSATLMGRLTRVHKQPPVYIDGGHNPDAMRGMLPLLAQTSQKHELIIVLGFLADKNVQAALQNFRTLSAYFIATTPDNPKRALPAATLADWLIQQLPEAKAIQALAAPRAAYQQALALAATLKDPVIFVLGSFYLLRQVPRS